MNREKQEMGNSAAKRALTSAQIMTILTVALVAAFLFTGMLMFVGIYQRSMEQNIMTYSDQAAAQTMNSLNDYLQGIESSMDMIAELYNIENRQERDQRLNGMVDVREDIAVITSYDTATYEIKGAWSGKNTFKWSALENLSFSRDMTEQTGIAISKPHVESLLLNSYPWVVSVSERVRTKDGRDRVLVLDANFSQIAGYIDNVGVGSHGYCFIMNADGSIIYHPQQQLIFAGLKQENTATMAQQPDGSYKGEGMIYSIRTRAESGWRVVAVSFPHELIAAQLKTSVFLLVLLLVSVVAAAAVSGAVLARSVSRPIERLSSAMAAFERDAEGFVYDASDRGNRGGSRELQMLSAAFAHMVVRIQRLMNRVRSEEVVLRKTELRALQAQINPHFLYNTLDSIAWMCEEGRNREAVKMVNALARLFRISISKGHELIPIAKEVEHARSYLEIQQFRYKNQFTYTFDVEECCLSYFCNKITLQPIIENAIYHGLNRMIDEGEINIRIRADGDDVVFSVADNGVGMTKEQCEGILRREKDSREGIGGIGIKNVNDRVKIYFGERYGISIESELDEGTTVYVRMPKLTEEAAGAKA